MQDRPFISVPKTSKIRIGPRAVKIGSKHTMLSLSIADNVILCKKKSKEALKKSKSPILLCKIGKIGSRAQKSPKIPPKKLNRDLLNFFL